MVGPSHRTLRRWHRITSPVRLRHRGRQAQLVRSTTVEPDRRAHADDRHRERHPQGSSARWPAWSSAAACSTTRRCLSTCAVVDETVGQYQRREPPRSRSREPQRPSPAVGDAHDASLAQRAKCSVQIPRWKRSTSRERDQDRRQMAVMNAANSSLEHDRAAAIRRLGDDGRRARRVRTRHSEQQLQARIRRTIRAQWNVNFAWAGVSAGRRRRRPLENAAAFFVLLVLPLSQSSVR